MKRFKGITFFCDDIEEFGAFVRAVRKKHGYSQRDLAESLQVSQGYLSDIERGQANMRGAMMKNLCEVLEIKAHFTG